MGGSSGAAGGQVDLIGLIKELRNDRVSLVQLPNQYELVHEACIEYAQRNGKTIELFDPTPPRPTTGPPPPVPVRRSACTGLVLVLRLLCRAGPATR